MRSVSLNQPSRILFFDTTQDWIEVGCVEKHSGEDFRTVYLQRLLSFRESSFRLVIEIEQALKESLWETPTEILITDGPGSFTGIRICVATGKTLAQLWKIPITLVHSLNIYAHFYALKTKSDVLLALDGKQGKLFTGGIVESKFLAIQDLEPREFFEYIEQFETSQIPKFCTGKLLLDTNPSFLPIEEDFPSLQSFFNRSLSIPYQTYGPHEIHQVTPAYFRGTYVDKKYGSNQNTN